MSLFWGGLVLLAGCSSRPTERSAEVQPLGLVATDLPDSLSDQALGALAADARRREARFLDAVSPGTLFRNTRVPQAEIAAGLWGTEELFQLGGQLFSLNLSAREGLGGADSKALRRFELGARGGPEALSCAACHWRGGPAGGGDGADNAYIGGDGDSQSSALARNPKALLGMGVLERLAQEMSAELAQQRDGLVRAAKRADGPLKVDLQAKGVSFGWLGVLADGSLDTRGLEGVAPDLVVRPFGWKGERGTLREVIEDEAALHLGMQSDHLARTGSPARVGNNGGADPDGDGVSDELAEGQVTALTLYLALTELPLIQLPARQDMLNQWSRGQGLFETIGCAGCHVPSLPLNDSTWRLPDRAGGPELRVDLLTESAEPRLARAADGSVSAWLFSDLRRHRMGPELADSRDTGEVAADSFLTPPLWGLARSRPYLHDGRAPTVQAAILAHGGEAKGARDAYKALPNSDQYPVRIYLASLNRAPRLVAP